MTDISRRLAALSPAQRAVLAGRLRAQRSNSGGVLPRPDRGSWPMSIAQERLWVLHQLAPRSPAYNRHITLRLSGGLDVPAMRTSFRRLWARHPVLRSTFAEVAGAPEVRLLPLDAFELEITRAGGEAETVAQVERLCHQPFALDRGPLLRAVLLPVAPDEHVLAIVCHHIISDGWSDRILLDDLTRGYAAALRQVPPEGPASPIDAFDFAYWQREWLRTGVLDPQVEYWRDQLGGGLPPLDLVPDRHRDPLRPVRPQLHQFAIPPTAVDALTRFARSHGATLFMALTAGCLTMLHRRSGQTDLVIGTTSAGRTRPELEQVLGYFVNTLPLRVQITPHRAWPAVLRDTREAAIGAFSHQDVPFGHIVEIVRPERDLARPPIVQVTCTLQNAPTASAALPGMRVEQLDVAGAGAPFPLSLSFSPAAGGLAGRCEYDAGMFDTGSIAAFAEGLSAMLTQAATPGARTASLPLPGGRPLLGGAGPAFTDSRLAADIVAALGDLGAGAVTDAAGCWSGAEIVTRAAGVAEAVQGLGVATESPVAVCTSPRGADTVAGLLGVWLAGGCAVPIDPEFPPARLAEILTRSGAVAVAGVAPIPLSWPVPVVATGHVSAAAGGSVPGAGGSVPAASAAYVMFTSGSTGAPKGVVVEHGALQAMLHALAQRPGLARGDTLVSVTPLVFDIALLELAGALRAGARLVIADDETTRDPGRLIRLIEHSGATVMQATPATWRLLSDQGWRPPPGLRVWCGGDILPGDLAALLRSRGAPVWNCYGPTEATIWAAAQLVDRHGPPPIGGPLPGVSLSVCDTRGCLVPAGVLGELVIGGPGVARGYLDQPGLTAERFVPDPLAPGRRAYRTGDLVRERRDGTLEFLGRADQQVKIRGYRIEPGDVESALRTHPEVDDAVVVPVGPPGEPSLAAYVVAAAGTHPDPGGLRAHTSRLLPSYLRPATVTVLPRLPLTPSGKVDRRQLPCPRLPAAAVAPGRPPATPVERELARCWAEVLPGGSPPHRDDDFFAAGGHSLLAGRLLALIRERMGVDVPLAAVFLAPTLAEMAEAITTGTVRTTTADLRAAAELDPDIVPPAHGTAAPRRPPADILLTGATGFLGGYVLAALLARTEAVIRCLVRGPDLTRARDRLFSRLAAAGAPSDDLADRVELVCGDLELPRLGMPEADFDRIAAQVEAVYHNAARVSFAAPYATLAPANVHGTVEVLRLATRHRPVPVHFTSTIGTTMEMSRTGGYEQTKWVAEQLVASATGRGLPAVIYRPGRLGGDTLAGAGPLVDLIWMVARRCIEAGAVPSVDVPLLVAPVDFVAAAIVHLSLHAPLSGVYDLLGRAPFASRLLFDVLTARGYQLQRLPFGEWQQRVIATSGPDVVLDVLSERLLNGGGGAAPNDSRTRAALASYGLRCPEVDAPLLDRWVGHFIDSGYFPPPGRSGGTRG